MTKKYRLTEKAIEVIRAYEFDEHDFSNSSEAPIIEVYLSAVEEIKPELKKGDMVRFKDLERQKWKYGFYGKNNGCKTAGAGGSWVNSKMTIIEPYEWTIEELRRL